VIWFNCCNISVRNKVSFGYAELVSMLKYYNFRMKHYSTLIETMFKEKKLCSFIWEVFQRDLLSLHIFCNFIKLLSLFVYQTVTEKNTRLKGS
jgi:hypothetical protein